jgi:hypothetical protein
MTQNELTGIRKNRLVTCGVAAGAGVVLILVGLALCSRAPTTSPSKLSPGIILSPEEYKASCRTDLAFKELDKNPDKYKGIKVTYRGQIVQIMERGQTTSIRMNITREIYGWGDTIYVTYEGTTPALEDDIIQVWGEVQGSNTYESIAGWKITLPLVKAKYVELAATAGQSK